MSSSANVYDISYRGSDEEPFGGSKDLVHSEYTRLCSPDSKEDSCFIFQVFMGKPISHKRATQAMRAAYLSSQNVINEAEFVKDPIEIFGDWFEEARNCQKIEEPNAMCLATSTKNGFPSARYVLLKSFSPDGFMFFSNYNSRKGKELEENPNAAVVFYWEALKKSVRIEGKVSKIPEAKSDEYFYSRPVSSQIGACVSQQSTVIESREYLEAENQRLSELYADGKVPRPKHWGGYILKPSSIEFWQGQSNRLHDRILFRVSGAPEIPAAESHYVGNGWFYERLSP